MNTAWYDVDGENAFVTAVNHLVTLGHRRIGFIRAPLQYQFAQKRLGGYARGLQHNGIVQKPELIEIAEFSDEGGMAAAGILLDLPTSPSAIVCVTDMIALGALEAIRACNLIPGDV